MFDGQGGKCAICERTSDKRLNVDHDHKTGEVRGLLCYSCNVTLGHVDDSVDYLRKLIDYLKEYRSG